MTHPITFQMKVQYLIIYHTSNSISETSNRNVTIYFDNVHNHFGNAMNILYIQIRKNQFLHLH